MGQYALENYDLRQTLRRIFDHMVYDVARNECVIRSTAWFNQPYMNMDPRAWLKRELDAAEQQATKEDATWEARARELRAALTALIGVSTREELEQLEVSIRLDAVSAPDIDKAVAINAIQVLLKELDRDFGGKEKS